MFPGLLRFARNDKKKKAAFTLAEVLITLGIIGIVAAMTMPMLLENTKKQQTVAQLKKSYSVLSQAVKLSELENGSCDYWEYTLPVEQFVNRYLRKFLTIQEQTVSAAGVDYKYLNGEDCFEAMCTSTSYMLTLADGTSMVVSCWTGNSGGRVVFFDLNGKKLPNTIGKDVFSFSIQPGVGVAPFGYGKFGALDMPDTDENGEYTTTNQVFGKYNREILTSNSTYACRKEQRGFWCAALILSDGWEIRDDYPW